MRKKDYNQLYPMVRIALLLVAVIWIGYSCFGWFSQNYIWKSGKTTYKAVIVSPISYHQRTVSCDLLLTDCESSLSANVGSRIKAHFLIDNDSSTSTLQIGDGLIINSRIKGLESRAKSLETRNFDYNKYLKIHGYAGSTFIMPQNFHKEVISLQNLSVIERTKLKMLLARDKLLVVLRSHIGNSEYPIVAAMALGDKTMIDKDIRETFSDTGVSHLLALSGLHISIIFSFIMLIFTPISYPGSNYSLRRIFTTIATIIPIWIYVLLVGMPVSAVRSAVMITIYGLVGAIGRNRISINTIALAAIIILAFNPLSLFDVGFQLSFLALSGIHIFFPILDATIDARWLQEHRAVKWFWSATLISISAQAATAPLIAYYFGTFSFTFLLANYFAIPLATLILYGSCIFFITSPIAILQLWIGKAITTLVLTLTSALKYIAALPYTAIHGIHINKVQVIFLYVILAEFFWFWQHNHANRLKLLLITVLVFLFYSFLRI